MRRFVCLVVLIGAGVVHAGPASPPVHIWLEPEWFDGVKGGFAYWTGTFKPTGSWGIAGPGIAAEWTQGGESEWNSIGAAADETKARCQRDVTIPRAGTYKIWVRYVDHRNKTEPFKVIVEQAGKKALEKELGVEPVLPPNDEYMLYWGFSFGWGSAEAKLDAGPARLILAIDKAGQGWRQLDAVLITEDLKFVPSGREKPSFAYHSSFGLQPNDAATWRGSYSSTGQGWKRPALAGRDFGMWTGIDPDPKWWAKQDVDRLTLYDIFFQFSPPADIRDKFHKEFAGKKDVPIMSWPRLLPGFHLGGSPDFSPGTPLRRWFEKTKTPFYIMTNYANGNYDAKTGPATYAALTGPLADQFLGYIHGEAIGTMGVAIPESLTAKDRRTYADLAFAELQKQQAAAWSKIYKTNVPTEHWQKGIPCLSVDSISFAHLFHETGAKTIGYEIDATNVHVPMRIAFERGAARQYGGAWINYASSNFGDSCNYFTQQPVVPRGAPAWYHSRYAITDGVSAAWYRKLYYLNYLGGASAIYWEQNLTNQYMLPGPGTHPVQLSPFGRATEDFQAFVDRLPDRGEPYTPIAFLLSHGHGWEKISYRCKMLHNFSEDDNDRELRELFDVAWYPSGVLEGLPAASDVQSMPSGTYGDIFDVLVDRPGRAKAIFDYPVVWAAGDVRLDGAWPPILKDYVSKGGTLVLNTNVCTPALRQALDLGYKGTGKVLSFEEWTPREGDARKTTPYRLIECTARDEDVLAWAAPKVPLITRHKLGKGSVIVTHVPHMLGLDERAHPALPYLMNGITARLLPIEVLRADGTRPQGEVMYQLCKTKDGYVVMLVNNRGIDKTQNGIARVDRRQFADVLLRTKLPVQSVREYTQPRGLETKRGEGGTEIQLRVPAGDLQVVYVKTN